MEQNTVKEIRDFAGLTQKEFAEVTKISVKTIQNWEQGRTKPSLQDVQYLINLFNDKR